MGQAERDHIIEILEDLDVAFSVYSHEHIHTSEEAAEERDHDLDETVKSLILSVDDRHVLYALPGDRLVDFDDVADAFDAESASLGDPDVVEDVTGCEVGSVPPFGPCLGLESYVDQAVLEKDAVHASLATHTDSVKIDTDVFDQLSFSAVNWSHDKTKT